MRIVKTDFNDLILIENFNASDSRGTFVKTYNQDFFLENKIQFKIKESFLSINSKNVIRGMHFQKPPFDHSKLVFVSRGSIIDVVVDLRKKSPTFLKTYNVKLSSENNFGIFIPKGFAHGFKSLKNDTQVNYFVDSVYNKDYDTGILYSSVCYDWNIIKPIISKRDLTFEALKKFNSPF